MFAVAVFFGSGVAADEFEIVDREGFSRALVAKTAKVPKGWNSSGRIAWNKPCSGNDLYETLFLTQAPDGSAGARIMPGYQFLLDRAALTPGYAPDPMLNLMLAHSEGVNQEMATLFRGSNCAVADFDGSDRILQALIVPQRPGDVRVIEAHIDQPTRDEIGAVFGQGIPGIEISYDARIVEMQYTRNGVPTTEWLFLSWYKFDHLPIDMGGVTVSNSHTVVEPLRIVWAPTRKAADLLPRIASIFGAIRTEPEWRRRVDERIAKIKSDSDKERARREAERDRKHREFLEYITGESAGGGGSGGGSGSGGAGSGGSGGSDTGTTTDVAENEDPDAEKTDYWGNPIEKETDFWGDPIEKETDFLGNPIETE
ncbi:MAG: hypothetical protein AAGA28_04730 [Pseudomonadota bacterium]